MTARERDIEYFTDFEELQGMSGHVESERTVRTFPWTLEDFIPVFERLGLEKDGDEYTCKRTVQTGRVVVNGNVGIQTKDVKTSFRFDNCFTAEMDGYHLAGIWANVSVDGKSLLSELIYCTPEDICDWYAVYGNMYGTRK